MKMCVHWMPQMSWHECMDMNTCALFGSNYGPVANLGVCKPRDDAYFSIRGSWDGNEGAFHSLACSCCMDDPNWGLWLGCSQYGKVGCNVTHMVMLIMNVGYIKYWHAIVWIYALFVILMMIVNVTWGQRVHASPRWNPWYSFTSS